MAAGLTLGASGAAAAPVTERDVTIAEEIHIMQEFHNDTFGHAGQCARLESANFFKMNQLLTEFFREIGSDHAMSHTEDGGYNFANADPQIASAYIDRARMLLNDIKLVGMWNECDTTRSKRAFSAVAYVISEYGKIAVKKLQNDEINAKSGAPPESEPPRRVILVDPDKMVPDLKLI